MKLELKHLAPYLPYGLKWYCKSEFRGKPVILPMIGIDGNLILLDWSGDTVTVNPSEFNTNRPILRNLSDLTKEIKHNGERFVPIDEFFIRYGGGVREAKVNWKSEFVDNILYSPFKVLPYGDVNQLIEWHFDVFGLIESGLAVDINTIK